MKSDKLNTVAVIPAYNEESSIAKVILRTKPYVDEIIVCDDGSMDMTFSIAKALGVRVVRHGEKRGKGEALRTLFSEAMKLNPEILVTLDGDDQHDPDAIPMLIKPIEAGKCDIVVGSRYVDGGEMNAPTYRRWGLKAINLLYRKFANVRVKDTQSGFRAYSRKTIKYLVQYDAQGYGTEGEQLAVAAKNGLKVTEVPISVNYKQLAKNSKKNSLIHGAELMSTLLRLITEERPLMYLGLPGIGLTCGGVVMGLYVVWMFNMTRYFSMPVATLTVGSTIGGLLLIIASITLHGLKRIREGINKFLDSKRSMSS